MVHTVAFLQFIDFASVFIYITKDHGPGSTSCGTGGLEFPILYDTTLPFGIQNGLLCFLDTHGTFFHYPPGPHGNIGIYDHFAQVVVHMIIKLFIIRILEPVKPSHFVRTVIGTVPVTHTSVIGHMVLLLASVRGCRNRADRFTGGMVTVLAHYRLKSYLRIGCRIFHFIKSAQGALIPEEAIKFVLLGIVLRKSILGGVIPIYSQPVHVPGL